MQMRTVTTSKYLKIKYTAKLQPGQHDELIYLSEAHHTHFYLKSQLIRRQELTVDQVTYIQIITWVYLSSY